jgi:peptidoglycan/xylan/chitin deacetylase (PgdA/CDA1 family)/glycosyltransferase involved in cell wall biosynthesis
MTAMPQLSIIIPTYNRAERLRACLEALCRQELAPELFEVIVVVDGSTDGTMGMLEQLETPFRLHTIRQDNAGQASARNRGIAAAEGAYCLFIDDDIIAAPGLAAGHLDAHRSATDVVAVGQLTITLPEDADWYARAFADGWRNRYAALNRGEFLPTWEDCYGGNVSAPRDKLLAVGGFAAGMARGHDVELGYRLSQAGCRFVYLPDAVGCQDEHKGFAELSRDAENAGFSSMQNYRRDPAMFYQGIGAFAVGSWRKLLLRRLLLGLRVPPRLIAGLAGASRTPARRQSWHAFIQNLCFWRGVRRAAAGTDLWRRVTRGTPILLYHAVGPASEPAGPFVMPAPRFESHMKWIRRLGYQPISLREFIQCHRERRFPPARSVVVTLDDGYEDNFRHAYPVLRRHGIPATIFLVSDAVGRGNHWTKKGALAGRPMMNWDQIRAMRGGGIDFGAHSRTHPRLTELGAEAAAAEIAGSGADIERALGSPITAFAYPYGLHDDATRNLAREAGYAAGCTVDPGLNGLGIAAWSLCRAEVWGTDSIVRLWLALWLGNPEALARRKRR